MNNVIIERLIKGDINYISNLSRDILTKEFEFTFPKLDDDILFHTHINTNLVTVYCVAAYWGHVHIIEWLYNNRIPINNSLMLLAAASRGYIDIIKFCYNHMCCEFTPIVTDTAAINGHYDIVKYLYLHTPQNKLEYGPKLPNEDIILELIRNNHLKILKFYNNHNILNTITNNEYIDFLELIYEHPTCYYISDDVVDIYTCFNSALEYSVMSGQIQMLEYVLSHKLYSQMITSTNDLIIGLLCHNHYNFAEIIYNYNKHNYLLADRFISTIHKFNNNRSKINAINWICEHGINLINLQILIKIGLQQNVGYIFEWMLNKIIRDQDNYSLSLYDIFNELITKYKYNIRHNYYDRIIMKMIRLKYASSEIVDCIYKLKINNLLLANSIYYYHLDDSLLINTEVIIKQKYRFIENITIQHNINDNLLFI